MKTILSLIICLCTFHIAMAQNGTISVHIKNIKNDRGNIEIGLYNQEDGFTVYSQSYLGASIKARKEGVSHTFENIPSGRYAISVFHDKNSNKKIDKNWLGIPTENYGFSKNKFGTFGPPDFEDVSFTLAEEQSKKFVIKLK